MHRPINIETDFFFEEDNNVKGPSSYASNNLLINQEKASIILESTLETIRLRRLISAFKSLSEDPNANRLLTRKYSSH